MAWRLSNCYSVTLERSLTQPYDLCTQLNEHTVHTTTSTQLTTCFVLRFTFY